MRSAGLWLPAVAAVLIACGGGEQVDAASTGDTGPVFDVVKVDSIGIELGDSNYVFGIVIDATVLSDGRIAILDLLKRKVSVFSPEGWFLGSAGSEGSGPGEFITPMNIAALSGGGFAVTDVQQGKIVFFDAGMEYSREITGIQPMAPNVIDTGPGGGIVAKRPTYFYDDEEDEMYSGTVYEAWSDSTAADVVYREDVYPHAETDREYYSFQGSGDGRLYCTLISKSDYRILFYDSTGSEILDVQFPWEERSVTPEELDAARPYIVVPGPGSEATMAELSSNWTPDSLRYSARIIGIDGDGRIWIKSGRGESASQVFELLDASDGSLVLTVESSLPAISRYWGYSISAKGMLGWDHNPGDYPRVYILEMVEVVE